MKANRMSLKMSQFYKMADSFSGLSIGLNIFILHQILLQHTQCDMQINIMIKTKARLLLVVFLLWCHCAKCVLLSFFFFFFFVLRFYGPVNSMGSCRARSVYPTTRLLGRLSPLS